MRSNESSKPWALGEALERLRDKRLLCLGNIDNIGLRYYLWAKKHGLDADLVLTETEGRGDIRQYGVDPAGPISQGIIHPRYTDDDFIRRARVRKRNEAWEREYDLVFVTGWHGLMLSADLNLPKIFTPSGYEIYWACSLGPYLRDLWKRLDYFFDPWVFWGTPRRVLDHLRLFWTSRKGLRQMGVISEIYSKNVEMIERLAPKARRVPYSLGENVAWIRGVASQSLLQELETTYREAQRVFLWLSRLNMVDPRLYKGPERFLTALERILPEIEQGRVHVVMGRHGEDVEAFLEIAKKSPVFPYVRWVGHLSQPELGAYLSFPKSVLFAEFGDHNHPLSGIGRSAFIFGTPLVSSMSASEIQERFGEPSPHFYANEIEEIVDQMRHLLQLSPQELEEIRVRTRGLADRHIEFDSFVGEMILEVLGKDLGKDKELP